MNFQIYYNIKPVLNEYVLVKFTKRNASHFEGELIEYNINCIMSYNNASKKKKVYNWNKIIPLEKLLVARIEEIYDNYVQVSTAYFDDEQKILLEKFNDNKILISMIKKLCYENKLEFNNFWTKIIHPIDKIRKEEETNDSLLKYFKDNFNKVKELIDNDEISNKLKEIKKNNKIITKIGLISPDGIDKTHFVINKIINNFHIDDYILKYESAPYYILETTTDEIHELFIKTLEKEAKENKIFTKIEYKKIN